MQMNFHRHLPIPQEVKEVCLGWEKTERLILDLAEKL